MKKEITWARIAFITIGIIWLITTLLPDYTNLFNF